MIRNILIKASLVLLCVSLLTAQEQPPLPQNSVPMVEVAPQATATPQHAPSITTQTKEQAAAPTETVAQAKPQTQSNGLKQENPQEPQAQPNPQAPAQNPQPPKQPVPETPKTEEKPAPSAQAPGLKTENVVPTPADDLHNLSQQQKKQLLHEQSIRAQLHANQDLKLSDLTNITVEQQLLLQKKFAQESRAAYQLAMKELQQRKERQRQERQRLLSQAKWNRSQQIQDKQNQKITNLYESQVGIQRIRFGSEYMFDMDPQTQQQLMLSLPVAQKIAYALHIYTNIDGVYLRNADIDNERPMVLKILENSHYVAYQSSFYFNDAHIFEGKSNYAYTFRFENADKHRLVSIKFSQILQNAQIQTKLKSEDLTSHAYRSQNLYGVIYERFSGLNDKAVVQTSNRQKLAQEIKLYFIYNLAEIGVFVITVLVQIQMIRRLLGSSSIV